MQQNKFYVKIIGENKGDVYKFISDNIFKNLNTGETGKLTDAQAQKYLRLNVEATMLLNKYPYLDVLINRLKLKIEIINDTNINP